MKMKLKLLSAGGKFFEVKEEVAMEFARIKSCLSDEEFHVSKEEKRRVIPVPMERRLVVMKDEVSNALVIPLGIEDSLVFEKVIHYCAKRVEFRTSNAPEAEEAMIKAFDSEFTRDLDKDIVMGMEFVAHCLDIGYLSSLMGQTLAHKFIIGKTPEQIRECFGIVNDFTPEEERRVRQENAWAFPE
uniref:SKP1-like protein n=1 Tax=Davidia involucrata TaxID=16924 RepID=A0A5B7C1L5_DAVIN